MTQIEPSDSDEDMSAEGPECQYDSEHNCQLSDFLIKSVGDDESSLVRLNEFFNQSTIKSELHWFTHRDTLERAANRDDRRLYYIAPEERYLAGLMVWCESRVLEPEEAQIRLVAVAPSCRSYGLGKSLVTKANEFARSYNKSIMIADVAAESPAVAFWCRCGFEERGQYETSGGRRMLQMERPL
jgi:ribosomal protein S18 acetylase RimI-like enzyme